MKLLPGAQGIYSKLEQIGHSILANVDMFLHIQAYFQLQAGQLAMTHVPALSGRFSNVLHSHTYSTEISLCCKDERMRQNFKHNVQLDVLSPFTHDCGCIKLHWQCHIQDIYTSACACV